MGATVDWDGHRVRERVQALERDPGSSGVFGAAGHGFRLLPPADEDGLTDVEAAYGFRLPDSYRSFLLHAGNGGAGPGYGLFPFFRFGDMASDTGPWADQMTGDPGVPLPLDAKWNLPDDQLSPPDGLGEEGEDAWFEEKDEWYFRSDLVDGTIPISHEGCAHWIRLVVSGPLAGEVWVDARAGDEGIAPLQPRTFEDWYLHWLQAIEESL